MSQTWYGLHTCGCRLPPGRFPRARAEIACTDLGVFHEDLAQLELKWHKYKREDIVSLRLDGTNTKGGGHAMLKTTEPVTYSPELLEGEL